MSGLEAASPARHLAVEYIFAAALTVLSAGGCSREAVEPMFPVAGSVTVAGQPLTVGAISFRADGEKGNGTLHQPTGTIDSAGNYRLETVGRAGAPPGWYKVLVFADGNVVDGRATHPVMPKWLVNVRYTAVQTTDLRIEVVESPTAGAYDLKLSK